MPRIPGLDPGGIDRLVSGTAGLGRRAGPRDFAAVQGEFALGAANKQVGQAQIQLFEAEMNSRLGEAVGSATAGLVELVQRVDQEPDHHKRQSLYESESRKLLGAARSGIGHESFGARFDSEIAVTDARGLAKVRSGVRQAQIEHTAANGFSAADSYARSAIQETDPVARREYWNKGAAAIAALEPAIGPLKVQQVLAQYTKRRDTEEKLLEGQILGDEIMADHQDNRALQDKAIARLRGPIRELVRANVAAQQGARDRARADVEAIRYDRLTLDALQGELDLPTLLESAERAEASGFPIDAGQLARLRTAINVREGSAAGFEFPGEKMIALEYKERAASDWKNYRKLDLVAELGESVSESVYLELRKLQTEQPPSVDGGYLNFIKDLAKFKWNSELQGRNKEFDLTAIRKRDEWITKAEAGVEGMRRSKGHGLLPAEYQGVLNDLLDEEWLVYDAPFWPLSDRDVVAQDIDRELILQQLQRAGALEGLTPEQQEALARQAYLEAQAP